MNRRQFIAAFAATSAAGCSQDPPADRYNQADVAALAAQREAERNRNGLSPFGVHRYQGYRELAQLPWFELNSEGRLLCVDQSVPKSIDVHAHLGMSVLFKPKLDLLASHKRVKHLLDCDGTPACELDLDTYANGNFSEDALKVLQGEIRAQGLWGSEFAATQTVPNLLREMDAMRVDQAILLPIKVGFWFGDELTEDWRKAVSEAGEERRLLSGFSIDPDGEDPLFELDFHAATGARVMKLHPTVQRFYPDDPAVMELYELAQDLGVIIFFHGGRAGIEPESSHRYAMPRHYEAALANFPQLQFILGHAGARDFEGMLTLAQKYQNAWLGIHGQGLTNLDKMIAQTGGERLLFGTDWPFYHIGMSLAKVLIATDSAARASIREKILRRNAEQLLTFI